MTCSIPQWKSHLGRHVKPLVKLLNLDVNHGLIQVFHTGLRVKTFLGLLEWDFSRWESINQSIYSFNSVNTKCITNKKYSYSGFPSVLWHCWLGDRKGIRPVKNSMLVCWWWWFDWSYVPLIAPVVTTTSIIRCFNKHRLTQVHLENGR